MVAQAVGLGYKNRADSPEPLRESLPTAMILQNITLSVMV